MRKPQPKQFCVYIMANSTNVAVYIGVTSDLRKRVFLHKSKAVPGFTARYSIDKLVYYEVHENAESAIRRRRS